VSVRAGNICPRQTRGDIMRPRGYVSSFPDDGGDMESFRVESERISGTHRVAPKGELDITSAPLLEQELLRVEGTDASIVLLDLGGLTFMDVMGLRVVLGAAARAAADSNRLRVIRPLGPAGRVLQFLGSEQALPLVD
jgi:anti-sigma B factor antagonist